MGIVRSSDVRRPAGRASSGIVPCRDHDFRQPQLPLVERGAEEPALADAAARGLRPSRTVRAGVVVVGGPPVAAIEVVEQADQLPRGLARLVLDRVADFFGQVAVRARPRTPPGSPRSRTRGLLDDLIHLDLGLCRSLAAGGTPCLPGRGRRPIRDRTGPALPPAHLFHLTPPRVGRDIRNPEDT